MIWLSLILFAFALLLMQNPRRKKVDSFFQLEATENESFDAINVKDLVAKSAWQTIKENISSNVGILGPRPALYIVLYLSFSAVSSWFVFYRFLAFL